MLVNVGTESLTVNVQLFDDTNGSPITGLAYDSAGVNISYARAGASRVAVTEVTLASADSAWSSGGFKEIDAANMPGVYRFDVPNAALVAGVPSVSLFFAFTGVRSKAVEIDLVTAVNANVKQISDDSTAADNLKSQYDAVTGLDGALFPSTQAQLTGIANTGAAVNEHAIASPDGFTITTGLNEQNNEDVTHADDGVIHSIDDDGGTLDCYYVFDIGGAFVPTDVVWHGRMLGNNDDVTISVNTGTIAVPVWETRSIVDGSNSSVFVSHTFTLFINDIMTGVDAGKVALRFNGAGLNNATLYTNQIICQKTSKADNTGYSDGAIWYNDAVSNENTVVDVDGTARNPVSTWAAVLTLSAATGIKRFHIINGSTVQLTGDSSNYTLIGDNWTLDLNGQIITGAHFNGASVSGICTGVGYDFHDCIITGGSYEAGDFINCALAGDMILTSAGTYYIDSGFSGVAGTATPSIDFQDAAENKNLNMRHYSGGIEVKNFGHNTGIHKMSLEGHGQIVINANSDDANANDTLAIRGHFMITDEVGDWGGTISDNARFDVDQIDAAITGNAVLTTVDTNTEFTKNMSEADITIDKSDPAQFQEVHKIKGTGTELARKDINDIDGNAVTSINTIPGQKLEP